jgi:DNA-binding MarR family transcriptional regulator
VSLLKDARPQEMPDDSGTGEDGISISGEASALVTSESPTLAGMLAKLNLEVRDFIVLSFVADQGPIAGSNLARMIGIDVQTVNKSVALLASAGLIEADGAIERLRVTRAGGELAQAMLQQI